MKRKLINSLWNPAEEVRDQILDSVLIGDRIVGIRTYSSQPYRFDSHSLSLDTGSGGVGKVAAISRMSTQGEDKEREGKARTRKMG